MFNSVENRKLRVIRQLTQKRLVVSFFASSGMVYLDKQRLK